MRLKKFYLEKKSFSLLRFAEVNKKLAYFLVRLAILDLIFNTLFLCLKSETVERRVLFDTVCFLSSFLAIFFSSQSILLGFLSEGF